MKPVILIAAAVAVTAGLVAASTVRPARNPRTVRDGLMPEVVVRARGPRMTLKEIVVHAERNPRVSSAAFGGSRFN